MNGDELLRESLRRAVSGEPPVGNAFARFQGRQRRAARVRFLTVVAAGLASAAILVTTLPGLSPRGAELVGGDNPPLLHTLRHYVDPVAGFQLNYPATWIARGVPGVYAEFFPRAQDGTDNVVLSTRTTVKAPNGDSYTREVARRLFVRLDVSSAGCAPGARATGAGAGAGAGAGPGAGLCAGALDPSWARAAGAVFGPAAPRMLDGRAALRRDVGFSAEPRLTGSGRAYSGIAASHYWCVRCSLTQFSVPEWSSAVGLVVRIMGPDDQAFGAARGGAEALVASLAGYPSATAPPQ